MTTFADLGLPRPIVSVLSKQGITSPFPIQEAAIPDALAGKDILGRGPTGSGKTFTFGLPIIARLAGSGASKPARPRADRKSTRLNSSHVAISYAVLCLKKKRRV